MAAPTFFSTWPTFHHHHNHNAVVPPPHDLVPIHNNFTYSDTFINNNNNNNNPLLVFNSNHHSSSFNNVQFHNTVTYPNLSSAYNPLTTQQPLVAAPFPDPAQPFGFGNEYYGDSFGPDACDFGELYPMFNPVEPMQLCNQQEYYSYSSYPVVPDACSMEEVQPELLPMPETYDSGGSSGVTHSSCDYGLGFDVILGEDKSVEIKENVNGCVRLSAQSMAARVRRRKISEKTSELGKLVPGGHRMTTAEMFQAAYKYIKFLQAQVGVLELMHSCPEEVLGSELQALLTCPSVQEKLYTAEKCIVTKELGETLAEDHEGRKNQDF